MKPKGRNRKPKPATASLFATLLEEGKDIEGYEECIVQNALFGHPSRDQITAFDTQPYINERQVRELASPSATTNVTERRNDSSVVANIRSSRPKCWRT